MRCGRIVEMGPLNITCHSDRSRHKYHTSSHVPTVIVAARMHRMYSFPRTLAVSLLLQGLSLGLFTGSGQFDLDVAVTYNLAGQTTTSQKPSQTDGFHNTESTLQQKDAATSTCTKSRDDPSGRAGLLSASPTSKSDFVHTTGTSIASGSSTDPSIAHSSSATWSRVIENPDEPSYGDLSQANPTASANVSHTNMTSYPTSCIWPSVVSAQPPTDNYTGSWTPPNPSDTRESSAAHALEWNNYITLGTLICGILGLS